MSKNAVKCNDAQKLDFVNAYTRMKDYANKTRVEFSIALKVKAPNTTGRLAGPRS